MTMFDTPPPVPSTNERILVIPDLHAPYYHPDTVPFLTAVAKKYRISPEHKESTVVCLGDEIDGHSWSFHESETSLLAADDELQQAIEDLQPLYELFPRVHLVDSNHGSLVFRKRKAAGIPAYAIKPMRDIINAPAGWSWTFDLTLRASNGEFIYFVHGQGATARTAARRMGLTVVQGHRHSEFYCEKILTPVRAYYGVQAGCLIDHTSMAFAYNKTGILRPALGCVVIIHGFPQLIPMITDNHGRWVGKLIE
jgi:hypothetical protein